MPAVVVVVVVGGVASPSSRNTAHGTKHNLQGARLNAQDPLYKPRSSSESSSYPSSWYVVVLMILTGSSRRRKTLEQQ